MLKHTVCWKKKTQLFAVLEWALIMSSEIWTFMQRDVLETLFNLVCYIMPPSGIGLLTLISIILFEFIDLLFLFDLFFSTKGFCPEVLRYERSHDLIRFKHDPWVYQWYKYMVNMQLMKKPTLPPSVWCWEWNKESLRPICHLVIRSSIAGLSSELPRCELALNWCLKWKQRGYSYYFLFMSKNTFHQRIHFPIAKAYLMNYFHCLCNILTIDYSVLRMAVDYYLLCSLYFMVPSGIVV